MNPRTQSAGTCGIVAGIALAIAFLLFISSGATPSTFADPAKALDFIGKNTSRLRLAIAFSLITIAFATVFLAGLAAKLRDKTPTRATAVLYLGVLGLVGHAVGSMLFGTSAPLVVAYAARDQVAASHAWVAVFAVDGAADGLGNLFIGLSTLVAGWAITAEKALSPTLGWFGVIAGVVGVAAFLWPTDPLMMASFVAPIVWLLWAGIALRQTK